MQKVCLLIILIAFAGFLSQPTMAEGGSSGEFGIIGGLAVPDLTKANPHRVFGIRGHAVLGASLGVGGYYLVSGKEEGSNGTKFEFSMHGFELAYHMPNNTGDIYFGLRVGVTKIRTKDVGNTIDLMFSPYHYGVAVGQQYFFWTNMIGIGYEGSILHAQPARTSDTTGAPFYQDAFNMLSFMGTLQLRF